MLWANRPSHASWLELCSWESWRFYDFFLTISETWKSSSILYVFKILERFILAGSLNIPKRTHPSNAFQYIETIDNSQSSVFEFQDYSNLQYSFHLLEQPAETFERIFKTFNLSTMLHAELLSRCIRNCSDYAGGISEIMFSGDGREGVSKPATKPTSK